ncbi:UNVERIFIED_CONTAM: hypothetical protein Scaly_2222400 [Sesamum calycinum]|uniref:Uncharacterized protein n=1 Tax=Sesamum calycinum TaxID=2727403 RepID=A0AAW2MA14_9LAMI
MTRFSGEGGAKYYEPREAHKRIHKIEFVSWACNMLVKDGPFKFVDDGHAEALNHNYFIAIRSSYLILRQGGRFIIEPYCPHRFGCQFGPKSIKITLKRKKNEDKQVDGGENNPPHALVPPVVIECDSQAAIAEASKGKGSSHNVADSDSSNKDRHWKRQKKEVTPLKAIEIMKMHCDLPWITSLQRPYFLDHLEDEVQFIDVGEESETSHSSTMTPPLKFLQRLWSGLLVKISNTPVNFLLSIEDDVYLILESMKSFHKFDVSKVDELLNTFFCQSSCLCLSSEKLSRCLHEQQLKEAKARLQDVQAKASEEASEVQSAMDELEHIGKEIVALKGEERACKMQLNHDTQAKVYEVEKDIATFESTGPVDDAIVENLESSRASLEILKENLKEFKPFCLRFA